MDIIAALSAIKDSPMPTILVIGGSIFLLLSLAGGIVGKISIPANRQKYAALIGGVMMLFGIVIYLSPAPTANFGSSKNIPIAEAAAAKKIDLEKIKPEKNPEKSLVSNEWLETDGSFDSNWNTGEYNLGEKTITRTLTGRIYRISGDFKNGGWLSQDAPYSPSKNFYLGFDFKFKDLKTASSTGVMFRKTSKTYLFLTVSQNRYIALFFFDGTKWNSLFDWVWLPKLDLHKFNRIEVVAKDKKLSILVNNRLIQETSLGETGNQSGNIALFVGSYETKQPSLITVDYKNFSYIH